MNVDPRLVQGVELFNRGEFFECHDVFEEVWNELRGDRKTCLQGLIQVAVGCYHGVNGNVRGAASQLAKALAKLRVHDPGMFGIMSHPLLEEVEALRVAAEHGMVDSAFAFPAQNIPKLQWSKSGML